MAESPLAAHRGSPLELQARLTAEREGAPFLVYRDPEAGQRIVALSDEVDRLTLGRSSSADVSLIWDAETSRFHAELQRVGNEWTIVDDGLSRNGTFVNGQRISGRRRLREGDSLRLGQTVIVYRDLGPESRATAPSTDLPSREDLTDAQHRVLLALCRPFENFPGYAAPAANQQIAEELFLSIDAVKAHMRALFEKLAVGDLPQNQKRARVVERAFQLGLVSQRELSQAAEASFGTSRSTVEPYRVGSTGAGS